jgi:hypothetical protein
MPGLAAHGRPGRAHPWNARNVASSTSGRCVSCSETSHSSAGFHRTAPEPRPLARPPEPCPSVLCRFHTCRPVYRGFSRIIATIRTIHRSPERCYSVPGPHSTDTAHHDRSAHAPATPHSDHAHARRRSTPPTVPSLGQALTHATAGSTARGRRSGAGQRQRGGTRTEDVHPRTSPAPEPAPASPRTPDAEHAPPHAAPAHPTNHQRLMHRKFQLDLSTRLRQPLLHTCRVQPRDHHPELIT